MQLPDGPDWESEDEHIGQYVRHDERFEDEDLVHAFSNAFQGPLLLNRIAEEDKDKRKDDAPDCDHGHANDNPVPDMDCEHSHV